MLALARHRTRLALVIFASLVLENACDAGNEIQPPAGLQPVSIGDLLSSAHGDLSNQQVLVSRVVVLADDSFDEVNNNSVGTAYFADPGNAPGHGMQAFAPSVSIPPGTYLHPGDIVDIIGQFVRFPGPPPCSPTNMASCFSGGRVVPQFNKAATVTRVGYWNGPDPIPTTEADFATNAASLQGSLVTITDLVINTTYSRVVSSSGRPRITQAVTAGGTSIGADLYRITGATHGTHIRRLTGIANYFYNDFIMPRGAFDVDVDPTSPVAEDGDALCADGLDNDSDGKLDCEDPDCCGVDRCRTIVLSEALPNPVGADAMNQWLEVYNSADYPVALDCASIGATGAMGWVGIDPLNGSAAAHACLVVGGGAPHIDVPANFFPPLSEGGSPGAGLGLFTGSVGNITVASIPEDGVIYGDDNANGLSLAGGVPDTADVATPPEGSSLERTSIAMRTWHLNATPTPGDCSPLMH